LPTLIMSNANALNSRAILNVPNQLTVARFILSMILFVLIAYEKYFASTILFSIAAGTDWLDGYYARKYGQDGSSIHSATR
jgi:CDP-diacylglycerol---glycerol-3-phosphate 3-phosphatidyltransferase